MNQRKAKRFLEHVMNAEADEKVIMEKVDYLINSPIGDIDG